MRPNFLLIGANKGGTTSIYNYLKSHPDIFVSPAKEPSFFIFEGKEIPFIPGTRKLAPYATTLEDYEKLFETVDGEKAVGECSTGYLTNLKVIPRIKELLPDVRIVAVLRNPIERAYSNYRDYVARGIENRTFSKAIREEMESIRSGSSYGHRPYLQYGMYAEGLAGYLSAFGKDRVHVIFFEDLNKDPLGTMRSVYRFLEVDDSHVPNVEERRNVSDKSDKIHLLKRQKAITWLKNIVPGSFRSILKPMLQSMIKGDQLTPAIRRELRDFFVGDIRKLESLVQRDLSAWKK
ncbi:MAG: sulfotransferase [Bacteroidetes bacterium]|nr:sulfotransferase [Bacteroidota bacterium]